HSKVNYPLKPAPTAFFFGTTDKVVPYKRISLFGSNWKGSDALVSLFQKNNYPYWAFRFTGHGHEVCNYMYRAIDEVCAFIQMALNHRPMHYDTQCIMDDFPVSQVSKLSLIGILKSDKGFEGLFDE
ncbi:MAG: hypothetical protein KBT04_01255, partial [Bacteroidales bacterium]|nr:hypothetical protein [Candidatus Colimorpha onthohippi]